MAPFPYMAMVAILASLVSCQVVQRNVFAYAGFMVQHLGVVDDLDESGYYAGLLSSGYMVGRLFSSHFWGLVADRYGCRFVMLAGLLTSVVLSLAFGVSTSFSWAFAIRYPYLLPNVVGAGLSFLALPLVLIYLKHGESSDRRFEGGLDYLEKPVPVDGDEATGTASPLPCSLGQNPIPGPTTTTTTNTNTTNTNTTTTPAKRWKTWVGSWFDYRRGYNRHTDTDDGDDQDGKICEEDRLPEMTTPAVERAPPTNGVSQWGGVLEQTTEAKLRTLAKRSGPRESPRPRLNRTGCRSQAKLLEQHDVRTLLIIFGIYAWVYTALDEIFSLWTLSTVGKGGLGWSTVQIGQAFLACGMMVLVFELFAVPNLTPRLGVKTSQRVGSVFEIPVYFLLPMVSRISGFQTAATVAALLLLFTYNVCTNSFIVGISLAINSAAGPARCGELNGMSVTVASFVGTLSPVFFSALFAFSIDGDRVFPFDYHLVFYTLAAVRLTVAVMGWNRIGGGDKSTPRRPSILAQ